VQPERTAGVDIHHVIVHPAAVLRNPQRLQIQHAAATDRRIAAAGIRIQQFGDAVQIRRAVRDSQRSVLRHGIGATQRLEQAARHQQRAAVDVQRVVDPARGRIGDDGEDAAGDRQGAGGRLYGTDRIGPPGAGIKNHRSGRVFAQMAAHRARDHTVDRLRMRLRRQCHIHKIRDGDRAVGVKRVRRAGDQRAAGGKGQIRDCRGRHRAEVEIVGQTEPAGPDCGAAREQVRAVQCQCARPSLDDTAVVRCAAQQRMFEGDRLAVGVKHRAAGQDLRIDARQPVQIAVAEERRGVGAGQHRAAIEKNGAFARR